MVADAGNGPDEYVALPVPDKARAFGVTPFAAESEAVPPLLTVIVTVIMSPTFTGVVAVRLPAKDAAATVKMGNVLSFGSYPTALTETLIHVDENC